MGFSGAYRFALHSLLSMCPTFLVAKNVSGIFCQKMCPTFFWFLGTKRHQAKFHKRDDETIEESNVTTNITHGDIANKRPKRAVTRSNFKENAFDL